jgi:hypothetical protein
MASLKAFLDGVAPILGLTPAALYERQRALVRLGVLTAIEGRGRGSGVPFTADNFAAVLISVLATDNLTEVDETIVGLCNAPPHEERQHRSEWQKRGKPTFKTELARALCGQELAWADYSVFKPPLTLHAVRVLRPRHGQMEIGPQPGSIIERDYFSRRGHQLPPVEITAQIQGVTLLRLTDLTRFALKSEEGEDE